MSDQHKSPLATRGGNDGMTEIWNWSSFTPEQLRSLAHLIPEDSRVTVPMEGVAAIYFKNGESSWVYGGYCDLRETTATNELVIWMVDDVVRTWDYREHHGDPDWPDMRLDWRGHYEYVRELKKAKEALHRLGVDV